MEAALYATVWAAVALFVAGEAGKRQIRIGAGAPFAGVRPRAAWAWSCWAAGAILCAIHAAVAFPARYAWSHDAAVRATAAQTEAVLGVGWGGGIYVNYVFIAVWIAEAIWWRLGPDSYFARPRDLTAILRAFYFVVLANAAVVFAAPARRGAGALLIAALLMIWLWPAGLRLVRAMPDRTGANSARRV
jgi:hypothetical protein